MPARTPMTKDAPPDFEKAPDYWIETFKRPSGWYWRIRASNGEIIQSGEAYASRSSRDAIVARFSLRTGLEVRKCRKWMPA
mgnify:FL=1